MEAHELKMLADAGMNGSHAGKTIRNLLIMATAAEKYSPLSREQFFTNYRYLIDVRNKVNISDARILAMIHQLSCRGLSYPGERLAAIFKKLINASSEDLYDVLKIEHDEINRVLTATTRMLGKEHNLAYWILVNEWPQILEFERLIKMSGE